MAVRREDYRPAAWLVPEVALDVALDPARTRVRARLEVVRNGDHREPLRLDGEGLRIVSLTVDGRAAAHKRDKSGLTVRLAGDRAVVEIVSEIVPTGEQVGLFELDGVLCTQCEPEHFRRISWFPDRPDVLARFRVRIEADRERYPVLLSNGDPAGAGQLDGGRHWAEWRDPYPKPCYLFALVAGRLVASRDTFVTASGREVALGVWTRESDAARTGHALASLKAAMRWDEQAYGCEYDLAAYNLVALPDFRFGAMENKGLAIHEAAQVLLDPATATDAELEIAAAMVAHEYLHNWSGNRVTVRDWFEMTLKEGLTVFRDQQFAADTGSAAVRRIAEVRSLRAGLLAGNDGASARAPRPADYATPAELFSATVYTKGAEIVRMVRTAIGDEAFRAGARLFFARHDGQAVRCEELLAAMGEAGGADLREFARWYDTPGTPTVRADLAYDRAQGRATVTLAVDKPVPAPLRLALIGAHSGGRLDERLIIVEGAVEVVFERIGERPVLSLNRGFSAPVAIEHARPVGDLAVLARHDDDPFARHEAMQQLVLEALRTGEVEAAVDAVAAALADEALEPALVAELVSLPSEAHVAESVEVADPAAIHAARTALRAELGRRFEGEWRAAQARPDGGAGAPGVRRLRNVALDYLLAGAAHGAGALALRQLEQGATMTDRDGALRALADSAAPERTLALACFRAQHGSDPRLLDRWFAVQAGSLRDDTIELAPRLLAHPDFTLAHPGRLGAIVGTFAATPHAFHDLSGRGYRFLADVVLVADRSDPATASRMARALAPWRLLEPRRATLMRAQLERIAAAPGVSTELRASVTASLA